MKKKQFTIYLENRPGALAEVAGALAVAEINIEGISVLGSTDVGLVQVVPANSEKASKVLSEAGVAFSAQEVSVTKLNNEPGALHGVLSRLAKKGVNINYVYATGCDGKNSCKCYAVISAPDLEKVEKALG